MAKNNNKPPETTEEARTQLAEREAEMTAPDTPTAPPTAPADNQVYTPPAPGPAPAEFLDDFARRLKQLEKIVERLAEQSNDLKVRADGLRIDLNRLKNPGFEVPDNAPIEQNKKPVSLNVLGEQVTRYV